MESQNLPFVEKYRPKKLWDILGNMGIVKTMQGIAMLGNMPNLLICGPPGTGKTTAVKWLANELLGTYAKQAVLELNASDDRGIDIVRNQIKSFAIKKVDLPFKSAHKIIILDEVDSMTTGAQQALRMTMTEYSDSTRFALACNDSSKIIDAIQSRCSIIRMSKVPDKLMKIRIREICESESAKFDEDGIDSLCFCAEGDMRSVLNSLQATIAGFGNVSKDHVYSVCDLPQPEQLQKVIQACLQKDFEKAIVLVDKVYYEGYNMIDIVGTLMKILQKIKITESKRLDYLALATDLKMKVLQGINSNLQLHYFLCQLWE